MDVYCGNSELVRLFWRFSAAMTGLVQQYGCFVHLYLGLVRQYKDLVQEYGRLRVAICRYSAAIRMFSANK